MADPVLPGYVRTLLVLPNSDGLPEDRYITSWCFRRNGASVEEAANAALVILDQFFNEGQTPLNAVGPYLGPQVSRVVDACKVVTYDLAEGTPRTPHSRSFTMLPVLTSGTSGTPLPAEVAMCMSMRTATNGPSGRGRVYLGPWCFGATGTSEHDDSTPGLPLRQAIAASGERLMDPARGGAVLTWCVLSQKNGAAYPVTAGYVDDAWDTQRRRGRKATGRVVWPTP